MGKIRQPKKVKIVDFPIGEFAFNPETLRREEVTKPIFLSASKNPKTIKKFKQLRQWLDRAIEWGEQNETTK